MRVKIAYTVELEEVETEVQEIISRGLKDLETALKEATDVCANLGNSEDLQSILLRIQSARISLFKADSNLSDCHDILKGYSDVLKKVEEEVENEET